MDDDAGRIASIMIGLADEGDEKSVNEAKQELRTMADELEKVPTIVAKSNLVIGMTLLHESKDYYRYVGAEVIMRIWRRKTTTSPDQILKQKTFICKVFEELIENYKVLSQTRIDAMKDVLQELKSFDKAKEIQKKDAVARVDSKGNVKVPINQSGGYNPTALLAMLSPRDKNDDDDNDDNNDDDDKEDDVESSDVSLPNKGSAIRALNVDVDDADSGETFSLDPNLANAILADREKDVWTERANTVAESPSGSRIQRGAAAVPGATAPATTANPTQLAQYRNAANALALDPALAASILADRERDVWRQRHVATDTAEGTQAPRSTTAPAQLADYKAKAEAMARKDIGKNTKKELDEDVIIDESGQAFELDESLAAKIMADRAGGVWGQRAADDDTSNSDSAPHSGFMAPQPTSNPSQLAEYKAKASALAADKSRPTKTAATHVNRPRAVLSGSGSTQGNSPNASLDTKRQRAREYASAAPPPTGATAQLQDYKTQAELLAAKLQDAARELAHAASDPADDEQANTTAEHSHASRPPADVSSSSELDSQRRRAKDFTPAAPAPTGAQTELADYRMQAMQLAEKLNAAAAKTLDDSDNDNTLKSKHDVASETSESQSLSVSDKRKEYVVPAAPAPTGRAVQLADYAAQAEALVAKLNAVKKKEKDTRDKDKEDSRKEKEDSRKDKDKEESRKEKEDSRKEKEDSRKDKDESRRHRRTSSNDVTSSTNAPSASSTSSRKNRDDDHHHHKKEDKEESSRVRKGRKTSVTSVDNPSKGAAPSPRSKTNKSRDTATSKDKDKEEEAPTSSKRHVRRTASQRDAKAVESSEGSLVRRATTSTALATAAPSERAPKPSLNAKGKPSAKKAPVAASALGAVLDKHSSKPTEKSRRADNDKPQASAPSPPGQINDKNLASTMLHESELQAQHADLANKISAIEKEWEGKPKPKEVLAQLMKLGLKAADIESKLKGGL